MNKSYNPTTIAPPYKNVYSHAVEIPRSARVLHLSGQLGVDPNGAIGADIEAQSEQVMQNIAAILESAGMSFQDVVKVNAYLLDATHVATFAQARTRYLAGARPAMTSVIVTALAAPGWLIEVDIVAARDD